MCVPFGGWFGLLVMFFFVLCSVVCVRAGGVILFACVLLVVSLCVSGVVYCVFLFSGGGGLLNCTGSLLLEILCLLCLCMMCCCSVFACTCMVFVCCCLCCSCVACIVLLV